VPPRSYFVGRWYARSDSVLLFLLQTIIPTAFSSQMVVPTVIANNPLETPPGEECTRLPVV
jgi:hypothetical protein